MRDEFEVELLSVATRGTALDVNLYGPKEDGAWVSAGLCPHCPDVHIWAGVQDVLSVSIRVDARVAEKLAQCLLNPQPHPEVEKVE